MSWSLLLHSKQNCGLNPLTQWICCALNHGSFKLHLCPTFHSFCKIPKSFDPMAACKQMLTCCCLSSKATTPGPVTESELYFVMQFFMCKIMSLMLMQLLVLFPDVVFLVNNLSCRHWQLCQLLVQGCQTHYSLGATCSSGWPQESRK